MTCSRGDFLELVTARKALLALLFYKQPGVCILLHAVYPLQSLRATVGRGGENCISLGADQSGHDCASKREILLCFMGKEAAQPLLCPVGLPITLLVAGLSWDWPCTFPGKKPTHTEMLNYFPCRSTSYVVSRHSSSPHLLSAGAWCTGDPCSAFPFPWKNYKLLGTGQGRERRQLMHTLFLP